jgi:hypothetical protein
MKAPDLTSFIPLETPMYHQDLHIGEQDVDTTFLLALHHLHLAAALFERFSPEEFAEAKTRSAVPGAVEGMLAAVTAQMELEAWLRDYKISACWEMAAYADNDPAIEPIWDRHAEAIRERLTMAGHSEEDVRDELGDMASVLHGVREANA